ncbi:MAG: ParB N-terminal domain-containing protein [Thermomicrobiales bacterium]|nr:ParB N-terminal domain-containing protein [Thermomicrobiales bacterium]
MEATLRNVPLTDIGDTVGTQPAERLRESVAQRGIYNPVTLAETVGDDGDIQYTIIDGNRRIASARIAGMESIPAIVVTGLSDDEIAQRTLVANGFRTTNYLTEYWAISQLKRSGYNPWAIRQISGMAKGSIDTRTLLKSLHRPLFVALRNGAINQQVATLAAKLPMDEQRLLAEHFEHHGRLTRADISSLLPYLATPRSEEEHDQASLADTLEHAVSQARADGMDREGFLQAAAAAWSAVEQDSKTGESFG